jgi:hypothetical protein
MSEMRDNLSERIMHQNITCISNYRRGLGSVI